jgi:two-component system, cell cycle response regulator
MKILIAESDPESCQILQKTLSELDYEIVLTHSGEEAWEAIKNEVAPTFAIIDWSMPEMNSTEFCRKLRHSSTAPYIYIITIISEPGKDEIVKAIEAGADDYISKPIEMEELRVRLRAGKRIMELQRALLMKSTYDALTGIWNRNMITEVLQRELARAEREGSSLGVVLAGLDKLKQINDAYGYHTGDKVVREVSKRIRAALRSYDLLGRYSGKEFLMILPGCDLTNTLKVAERARHIIARAPIENAEGAIHITISLGVANSGGKNFNSEQLIQAAVEALKMAKESGRNRIEMVEKE